MKEKKQKIADNHAGRKTVFLYPRFSDVESGRIRIHLGPGIRVQMYKMKGKQSLTDKYFEFFSGKLFIFKSDP